MDSDFDESRSRRSSNWNNYRAGGKHEEQNQSNDIDSSTLLETYSLDPDLFENDLTNTELQSNNTKMDVTKSGRLLVKSC